MEHVIHYIWKHKILKPDLKTTSGEKVEVIDPGTYNRDEGPDFFNAKIKIGDTVWAGNVEIHDNASDWYRHNHQNNKAYDNVILHVCLNCDCEVTRPDGTAMPALKIECPEHVKQNYDTLKSNDIFPACHTVIEKIPHIMRRSWLTYLQSERLEQKAGAISTMLEKQHGNMEDTFFIMLSRNFGFGVNNDAFQQWAASLPLRAVDKHRDNLMQVESIFFGMAGLLDAPDGDPYRDKLKEEFAYLSHKFSLAAPAPPQWKLLRMRPDNFPHIRIARLAAIYHVHANLFSRFMTASYPEGMQELLDVKLSDYWDTHYTFGRETGNSRRHVSRQTIDLIAINTIVPFMYVYGKQKGTEDTDAKIEKIMEAIPPENNHITRSWSKTGIAIDNAADSQAIIQLTKNYCMQRKCLFCRFGYEFLKHKES